MGLYFPSCIKYHHHSGSEWIIVAGGRAYTATGAATWNRAVNYYDVTQDLGWNTLEVLPTVIVWPGQSSFMLLNKYELYVPNTHSTYGMMKWDYKNDRFEKIQKSMVPLRVTECN